MKSQSHDFTSPGRHLTAFIVLVGLFVCTGARSCFGQAFGVELHNTLMPASGSMGGVSIARAQDVQSALNGNPANLAQREGIQFSMGGAWVEPTVNVSHTPPPVPLPNIGQFSAKSEAEGAALGNITVTQDLRSMGLPATLGLGLLATSGASINLRNVPASNGSTATIAGLGVGTGMGVQVSDRLSVGANLLLGNLTLDGPFVGITAATTDYALRGTVGINYDVNCNTTVGFYYQTKENHNFDDAIRIDLGGGAFSVVQDINMDLPENIGFGIANQSLMNGDLLLAVDVLFKQWSNAALWDALYDDQWIYQFGAQYTFRQRFKFRCGYVYAENAMLNVVGNAAGGVAPAGGQNAIQYVQALFGNYMRHRISVGAGVVDVIPGVNLDLFAGGMFEDSQTFGFTSSSAESYWIGMGMTWHFDGPHCGHGAG